MSLTTEKLQIESKISELKRKRFVEEMNADMYIATIRAEASTLLRLDDLDVVKIRVAATELESTVDKIRELDVEVRKLERML